MLQYKKFLIKDSDQFDPHQFPFVMDETAIIRTQTENTPPVFKAEIIIAFLKDHSIKAEMKEANPQLTALITSGSLSTSNFESLFDSCRNNPVFCEQMEGFLQKEFSE